jgi:hypothetical protein
LLEQVAGEAISPESFWASAEGNLEADFLGLLAVFAEKVKGVFEYLKIVSVRHGKVQRLG